MFEPLQRMASHRPGVVLGVGTFTQTVLLSDLPVTFAHRSWTVLIEKALSENKSAGVTCITGFFTLFLYTHFSVLAHGYKNLPPTLISFHLLWLTFPA